MMPRRWICCTCTMLLRCSWGHWASAVLLSALQLHFGRWKSLGEKPCSAACNHVSEKLPTRLLMSCIACVQQTRALSFAVQSQQHRQFTSSMHCRIEGKIVAYGMATWSCFRTPPGNPGHLSLQEVWDIAARVGGKDHGFRSAPKLVAADGCIHLAQAGTPTPLF